MNPTADGHGSFTSRDSAAPGHRGSRQSGWTGARVMGSVRGMKNSPYLYVVQGERQGGRRPDGKKARRNRIETALSAGVALHEIRSFNRVRAARRAAQRGLRVVESA